MAKPIYRVNRGLEYPEPNPKVEQYWAAHPHRSIWQKAREAGHQILERGLVIIGEVLDGHPQVVTAAGHFATGDLQPRVIEATQQTEVFASAQPSPTEVA